MAGYSVPQLQAYADQVANDYGIPSDAFSRLFYHESRWNPNAYNPEGGAAGIGQMMPTTYQGNVDPYDPFASIRYAGQMLSGYFKKFGNWDSAFAAYASGAGTVSKYGGVPPAEKYPITNEFVDFVMGRKSGAQTEGAAMPLPNTYPASGGAMSRIIILTAGLILLVVALRNVSK